MNVDRYNLDQLQNEFVRMYANAVNSSDSNRSDDDDENFRRKRKK